MKILLGISGGVDSATSAKLLMDEGNCVEGAVLLMHEYTELDKASQACYELGIKLNVIDAKKSFNIIKDNFVTEYSKGRTPNPCIICNERVKFRLLYVYAMENGFDAISTGHYARVVKIEDKSGDRFAVSVPADVSKDQTYMLYRLPQEILSRLIFPLADIKKYEVRKLAKENAISAADKGDSQEICFLPEGGHAEYIESVLGEFPRGNFVDEEGNILGEHKGIIRYTVGQRKGLGISLGERAFVTKIDPTLNTVTLSTAFSGREELTISDMVFSGKKELQRGEKVQVYVRVRYTAPFEKAEAEYLGDKVARLCFDNPVKAASGQSAVAYGKDGTVLFGGFIN